MEPIPNLPEGTMKHSARVTRGPRWGWPSAMRAAIVIIVSALALVVTACGSSSSPTSSDGSAGKGGSSSPSLLSFAQCMRSNGLPNFPDPSSDNKFPSAQQLGVSDSQYQAAETACQRQLPAGSGGQFPAAEVQQLLVGMRAFSQCMRSHGVTNWPDPSVNSSGQPDFQLSTQGITRDRVHSPQMMATENRETV